MYCWRCFARVRTDIVAVGVHATPPGIGADDLADAYELDTSVDPNATIAIVGAYGYANLESDLSHYRSAYGLPACTTANGCLTIVNQQGQTSPLPQEAPANDDWTQETALDVDMASAACPKCKLLVVMADDDQGDGLFIANNTAASLHATVISNSWGGPEDNTTSSYETYFNHAGIGIFGQFLYIDPHSKTVIVTHSAWPTAVGRDLSRHRGLLVEALAAAAARPST